MTVNYLYITGDAIGTATGGGKVTHHESEALKDLASMWGIEIWDFPNQPRPWGPDEAAGALLEGRPDLCPKLAHFYSGTFTKTIEILKSRGAIISYTAAAHDIEVSKREHELLGIPFDYPHLTDAEQWTRYVRGYLLADLVICPSTVSERIMRGYGCRNVVVIPHGHDPVDRIAPLPTQFVVGYLGQPGPDKGLFHLVRAWEQWCGWRPAADASLMIAGRGTLGLLPMVRTFCAAGSVFIRGEVDQPRDLYDACAIVVQPSASEGFGMEVLEARAHGRPVICSDGAGACTFANQIVPARNVGELCRAIDMWHRRWLEDPSDFSARAVVGLHASGDLRWEAIRKRYVSTWSDL